MPSCRSANRESGNTVIEPLLAQPVKNDVDRRALFADKQDSFPACHVIGDQVGDGL